jgi:hypothetical protein
MYNPKLCINIFFTIIKCFRTNKDRPKKEGIATFALSALAADADTETKICTEYEVVEIIFFFYYVKHQFVKTIIVKTSQSLTMIHSCSHKTNNYIFDVSLHQQLSAIDFYYKFLLYIFISVQLISFPINKKP